MAKSKCFLVALYAGFIIGGDSVETKTSVANLSNSTSTIYLTTGGGGGDPTTKGKGRDGIEPMLARVTGGGGGDPTTKGKGKGGVEPGYC